MKQQRKVIHVELHEPYQGKRHYYFGSVAAIYDVLPLDVVGIARETLWNTLNDGEYTGRRATNRKVTLHSKENNRGIKKGGKDDRSDNS